MSNRESAIVLYGMALIGFAAGAFEGSYTLLLASSVLTLAGNWQHRLSKREGDGG